MKACLAFLRPIKSIFHPSCKQEHVCTLLPSQIKQISWIQTKGKARESLDCALGRGRENFTLQFDWIYGTHYPQSSPLTGGN